MKKRCPEIPGFFQVIFLSLGMLVQGCSVDYPMGDFLWSDSVEQPDTFIPETCNNGTLDDGEFCDPTAVQSADCRDISSWFVSGVASCTADCRWDLGDCVRHSKECGNGILEPGEACEPSLNPSASCASLSARYVSGVAECDNWCSFDVTSCVVGESNCGDGILEGEEECDNGLENGASRCSLDCRVLSNGENARFEAPEHAVENDGISPFMSNWVCADPQKRAGWRNRSSARVNYEIHICQIDSAPVVSLDRVRSVMADVDAVFSLAAIDLFESSVSFFTWPNCTVNYDSLGSFNDSILNRTADNAIPLVFVRSIVSSVVSFSIGGYGGPNSPVVGTSASHTVITHELGHKFGLSHTFECKYGLETSSECNSTGDRLCDTPADHGPDGVTGIAECIDETMLDGTCDCEDKCGGTGTCTTGERPDCSNIMSYYHCWPGDFSNGQMDYIRCSLENELNHFVASCQARAETCNGIDDDCDGKTDENLSRSCGRDEGVCRKGVQLCSGGKWGECQGSVGGVAEACDGIDNDCDGQTDEGLFMDCGSDVGECVKGRKACSRGTWETQCVGGVTPRAEICDNRDNDCDGSTDEGMNPLQQPIIGRCPSKGVCSGGNAVNVCTNGIWQCEYPSGFMETECKIVSTDCGTGSSGDKSCNDSLDNDCDGVTDENSLVERCRDHDDYYKVERGDTCFSDSYGRCQRSGGTYECIQLAEGCGVKVSCVPSVSPETERCDDQDWDCDGNTFDREDDDNDGYGDCPNHEDCDETNPKINPGATEVCDGLDNDCDKQIDENVDCGINKHCVDGKCSCYKTCGTSCCPSASSCCGSYCMPNSATCAIKDDGCYCPAGYDIAQKLGNLRPSTPKSCYPSVYEACGGGSETSQRVCPLGHTCCGYLSQGDVTRCCKDPDYSDDPFLRFYCINCPDEREKISISTIPFTCGQTN